MKWRSKHKIEVPVPQPQLNTITATDKPRTFTTGTGSSGIKFDTRGWSTTSTSTIIPGMAQGLVVEGDEVRVAMGVARLDPKQMGAARLQWRHDPVRSVYVLVAEFELPYSEAVKLPKPPGGLGEAQPAAGKRKAVKIR